MRHQSHFKRRSMERCIILTTAKVPLLKLERITVISSSHLVSKSPVITLTSPSIAKDTEDTVMSSVTIIQHCMPE